MKTTLLIGAAAAIAGGFLIKYLMKNKEAQKAADLVPVKKSHHLTNVFSQAKNH